MTIQSDSESSPPRRPNLSDQLGKPRVKAAARRFRWRAVIHSGGKLDPSAGHPAVAWHHAECSAPASRDAHCEVGRRLIEFDGNPDGHCQVGETCPRCDEAAAAIEVSQTVQEQVEQALEAEASPAPDASPTPPDDAVDEPRPAGA